MSFPIAYFTSMFGTHVIQSIASICFICIGAIYILQLQHTSHNNHNTSNNSSSYKMNDNNNSNSMWSVMIIVIIILGIGQAIMVRYLYFNLYINIWAFLFQSYIILLNLIFGLFTK